MSIDYKTCPKCRLPLTSHNARRCPEYAYKPTDSQPASDLVEKAGDETCPLCQSGLKSSNDKRVWICPNKKCRLSNWYLPLTTFSGYRKILDSRDERRICKVMFKHYCSGIVPDERTEGGYKTGFADAFAVLNTEHVIIRKMADFANLHASQQNADLSRKVRELEGLLKVAKCPTCDGSGMYPQHSAYCNGDCQDCPEPVQCEWCDRRQAFTALEDK